MIRTATENDKKSIFDLYGRSGTLNFVNREDYFAKKFKAENVLVNEVNGHVSASLQIDNYPLMLNSRKLSAGYVFGRFYDHSKGQRWMNALMQQALDQQAYQNLVTIIPSGQGQSFASYGFEEVYQKRMYTINRQEIENRSYQGVSKQFSIDELSMLYDDFVSHFDGYFLRDRQYWLDLLDYLQFKHYNLAVYHDQENRPQGYMIYYIEASRVVVNEIIYANGTALTRLVCYCLRLKNSIRIFTSRNEDLSRAFPKIRFRPVTAAYARINDLELFNRLYGSNVSSTMEGFYLSGLPLYMNEESL